MQCLKCKGEQAVIKCDECEGSLCLPCSRLHFENQEHVIKSYYFCQECQEEKATKYCYSCDQNLCASCNARIHNKGKRGQHKIQQINGHQKFLVRFLIVVLEDIAPNQQDFQGFIATLKDRLSHLHKGDIKKQQIYFLWQKESSLPQGFSYGIMNQGGLSEEYLKEYGKYFPVLQKTIIVDSPQAKEAQIKLSPQLQFVYLVQQEQSKNNISIAELQSRNNISISTQNQSIAKGRKPAIAYFQFYKLAKNDKKSEVEIYMRKLAAEGQLLVKQKQVPAIQGIVRSFIRTVGQLEIEYSSLDISYLSVESLVWVIRSIKIDKMTPGQKLVLSRIKQCFDIKVHSKLWQSILLYLSSKKYQQDHQRMASTYYLPKIILQKSNDQHLLLLKNEEWVFQDQQKLNQSQQSWNQFVKFLLDYFDNHKTIPGGRYGCVQFAKMFGTKSLQNSTLGKLSMYVQQAINKGIIRYHKTLLIKNVIEQHQSFTNQSSSILQCDYSFNLNQKQLYVLQKEIKIKSLQVAMISLLCEQVNQSVLSLAQIPHNLKKCVSFDFNLPDLGFPKLKNLIVTLSDIVKLQINKSTLTYAFHSTSQILIIHQKQRLQMMLSDYFRMINEILQKIMRQNSCIGVNELFNQLNSKIGFEFEFRLYGATDFCHFLYCYCVDIVNIQIVNGSLIAYSNQPVTSRTKHAQGAQISTPDFCNSFEANNKPFKLPEGFYSWVDDLKEQNEQKEANYIDEEMGEGISDIEEKHLYSIMDDDGEKSETTLRTFIQKQNIANNLNLSIYTLKPEEVIVTNPKNHNKALSQDFDAHKRINTHGRSTSYVQGKNKTPQELQG